MSFNAAGSTKEEPKPEVFIGRVPTGTTKEALEAHFGPHGGQNVRVLEKGNCAFATFSSFAEAERAIQATDGLKLDANHEGFHVKLADVRGSKGKTHEPKVFIGGIGLNVTEDAIRQVCQQYGEIIHSKIFSRNSSAPCAFVTFGTFSEAENCISALNGVEDHPLACVGKAISARIADQAGKTPARTSAPASGFLGGGQAMVPFAGQSASPYRAAPSRPSLAAPAAPYSAAPYSQPPPAPGGGTKLFIGGLPEGITEEFVHGMMAPYGQVTEAKIHSKPGAQLCGFATFADPAAAEWAISVISGTRFTVKYADDRSGGKRSYQAAFPQAQPFPQAQQYGKGKDWFGKGAQDRSYW